MALPGIDEQLAAQYQPGTDLGDELRDENIYLNAENKPIIPAPQHTDVTAPEIPLGWSERLSDAANQIGVLPGVGGWAKSLVASAVAALPKKPQQPSRRAEIASNIGGAVQGITNSLSDVAAIGTVPSGGGALTGIGRTLAARGERLSQQQTQQILRAESQARTVALMRNIYRQDRDDRLASYKQTADLINGMREDHNVQEGITQSQLTDMLQKNPKYWETHTGGAVGERPAVDGNGKQVMDQNGVPAYEPVYSIAEIQTKYGAQGSHEITQTEADYFKRNTGTELPVGTKLDSDQYIYLYKKSHGVQDTVNAIQKANDEQLSEEHRRQLAQDLQDSGIQAYSSSVPGQPLAGLYNAQKNAADHINAIDQQIAGLKQKPGNDQAIAELQQKRQKFTDEQQKIQRVVNGAFNDTAKEKYADYQLKVREEAEKERHNRAEEVEKAKKNQDDANIIPPASAGLHGEAYLATLAPGLSATIRAIGEGRQTLSPRQLATDKGKALAEQLHQAYPDFDETKAKTWQKANNEYRGSGKTATQIVPAYNTALEHMQDLFTNTTREGIFNPLSKAYQDREVALGYVAREVGKAVSSGAMTQKEGEDLLNTLKGGLTPALKRERITKTAQLLHDKIDEYQTKFNESAPSSAIKVPTLISPKAAASYDFVTGKTQQQQAQPQQTKLPQAPQGQVAVQLPGMPVGFIPRSALTQFQKDHPDAQVGQ